MSLIFLSREVIIIIMENNSNYHVIDIDDMRDLILFKYC